MTTATKNTRPTHRVFAVSKKDKADKGRWTEIGALWAHGDGKGFNMKLKMLPLDPAELVIRAIEEA